MPLPFPPMPLPFPPMPDPFPPMPNPGPTLVSVPNVVGLSYTAAQQALTQKGLSIQAVNLAAPQSFVFSQSVAPGTQVSPATTVQVTMKVKVPNVTGLTFLQAKAALQQRGLVAQPNNATPPAAFVFSQQIMANADVYPGTVVGLNLRVKVPNITGMKFAQAKNLLSQQFGLNIQNGQAHPPMAFVFTQLVQANVVVVPGASVGVILRVKLPNVTGMSYFAARNLLIAQYGVGVQHGTGNINKTVISSNPMANVIMPPSNVVTLNTQP
jgi:beta-lactam-binding protein with PASTA domain